VQACCGCCDVCCCITAPCGSCCIPWTTMRTEKYTVSENGFCECYRTSRWKKPRSTCPAVVHSIHSARTRFTADGASSLLVPQRRYHEPMLPCLRQQCPQSLRYRGQHRP
jgi:hypothetical protein